MNRCGVNGAAVVVLQDGQAVWRTMNDAIHVSEELLADEGARSLIGEKYAVAEFCPEVGAYHARLR